jgi:hypothetical protein
LVSDRAVFWIASSKHPPINPVATIFHFERIATSLIPAIRPTLHASRARRVDNVDQLREGGIS